MEMKFCQSCGMPLSPEILGTNADGSKNEEYCIYCYKDGAFTGDVRQVEHLLENAAQGDRDGKPQDFSPEGPVQHVDVRLCRRHTPP